MNLKAACKTAIILSIVSFILIVFGQLFSSLMVFWPKISSHNGWAATPNTSNMSLFIMWLTHAFFYLLSPALLITGFITLLSGIRKQQHDAYGSNKKQSIIAAVLFGLAALVIACRTVNFVWIIFRHAPSLNFQYGLSLVWHLIATLCAITLCIFAAVSVKRLNSKTPTLLAVIFHCLLAVIGIAGIGNTLFFLTSAGAQHIGSVRTVFVFASLVCNQSGTFLRLAAILLFLFAWLKQKPQPPEAGVIDPSPEPVPTLSTKAELPEL